MAYNTKPLAIGVYDAKLVRKRKKGGSEAFVRLLSRNGENRHTPVAQLIIETASALQGGNFWATCRFT
jgi:hypothetical protein